MNALLIVLVRFLMLMAAKDWNDELRTQMAVV